MMERVAARDDDLHAGPHPTDRRKKYLVVNQHNRDAAVSLNMMQAMVEYYGDSVRLLERVG